MRRREEQGVREMDEYQNILRQFFLKLVGI